MSHVENTVQGLMAKVQEFASTWAVVDGPFDDGGAMQRANESKAQLEAMIVAALHTSATSLKALHALFLDGDLTEAARMCDQILAQQEQMAAVEPWKDHRTAALVNDLRDCAKTYGNTQQLRERIATIVAPLCAQLKTAELAAAPQAVQPAVPVGGQSRFKGEKDWQWCSPEHVAMVLATPSEWQGYEARYVYAHPAEGVPAQEVQAAIDRFDAYFRSANGVPPNARVSVPTAEWQELRAMLYTHPTQQGLEPVKLLAKDHANMRVDYSGLLGKVQREMKRSAPGYAEMIRQLQGHLQELGQRWYAGQTEVVDELLQLYCIESEARKAIAAQAKQGEQA